MFSIQVCTKPRLSLILQGFEASPSDRIVLLAFELPSHAFRGQPQALDHLGIWEEATFERSARRPGFASRLVALGVPAAR